MGQSRLAKLHVHDNCNCVCFLIVTYIQLCSSALCVPGVCVYCRDMHLSAARILIDFTLLFTCLALHLAFSLRLSLSHSHSLPLSVCLSLCTGGILAFSTSVAMYMSLRVIIGFASMTVTVVSFVLVVELVSGKWRTIIGILNVLPVAITYVISSGIAYLIRDWRTLQLVISLPWLIMLSIW